jgi:cyclophilin family peptidyl-prolyl cis-trans isomerase
VITLETSHGNIVIELFEEVAPISCENFRQYVTDGFFNDTIFHRVIPNLMARTAVVDSASSQFFINLNDNDFLNHGGRDFGYAVFGKVSDGMDVVDAIAAVATGNQGGHQDVPVDPVTIVSASIDG